MHDDRSQHLENYIIETDLKSFGVDPIWITNYSDIPNFLASITA